LSNVKPGQKITLENVKKESKCRSRRGNVVSVPLNLISD